MKNFNLDIWKTDLRVIISKKMISLIKKRIKKVGSMSDVFKLTKITRDKGYRLLGGKGSHNSTYYGLLTFLNLDPEKSKKEIIGVTYSGCRSTYPYINKLNQLLFRIICHIIGDGTITSGDTCRWIQNKSNSDWLKKLIKKEIGLLPTVTNSVGNSNCEMITIPSYFSKILQHTLGIDIKLIKEPKTISRFLQLPKDYRVQFVTSFIVDEGHIRYRGVRSCIISQSNKELMDVITRILDSLNYQHSKIKKEIDKKGNIIYRINIYSPGMLKFYEDLEDQIKKFGMLSGLWHKQKDLQTYIKTLNKDPKHTKIEKDFINNIIYEMLRKQKYITYSQLRNHPILKEKLKTRNERYLINKFYEMVKKGDLIRKSRGVFQKL